MLWKPLFVPQYWLCLVVLAPLARSLAVFPPLYSPSLLCHHHPQSSAPKSLPVSFCFFKKSRCGVHIYAFMFLNVYESTMYVYMCVIWVCGICIYVWFVRCVYVYMICIYSCVCLYVCTLEAQSWCQKSLSITLLSYSLRHSFIYSFILSLKLKVHQHS